MEESLGKMFVYCNIAAFNFPAIKIHPSTCNYYLYHLRTLQIGAFSKITAQMQAEKIQKHEIERYAHKDCITTRL